MQSAKAGICAEKRRLLEQLQAAVDTLTALQSAQSKDLIRGGLGLPRMDFALEKARAEWEKAKRAYWNHQRAHGC